MLGFARSLVASGRALAPTAAYLQRANLHGTAGASKASEPAYEDHLDEEDAQCAFQTKIREVLDFKDGISQLWCTDKEMVIDAVRKMTKHNVGSLLVFDSGKVKAAGGTARSTGVDACVGIITERDYLTKVVVEGRSSTSTPVAGIMTPSRQLAVLTPEHSVLEAMEIMISKNVRHVPVMCSDERNMVGILSIKDVVKVLLHDKTREVNQLKDYIHGTY